MVFAANRSLFLSFSVFLIIRHYCSDARLKTLLSIRPLVSAFSKHTRGVVGYILPEVCCMRHTMSALFASIHFIFSICVYHFIFSICVYHLSSLSALFGFYPLRTHCYSDMFFCHCHMFVPTSRYTLVQYSYSCSRCVLVFPIAFLHTSHNFCFCQAAYHACIGDSINIKRLLTLIKIACPTERSRQSQPLAVVCGWLDSLHSVLYHRFLSGKALIQFVNVCPGSPQRISNPWRDQLCSLPIRT